MSKSSIEAPTIMVDNGKCSFLTKTKNIQDVGGEVALIVNDNELDPREVRIIASGRKRYDVTIPTVLISKRDGAIIKDYIKNNSNKEIQIKISFAMTKKDVENIDLYYSSINEKVYEFLMFFRGYYMDLSKY